MPIRHQIDSIYTGTTHFLKCDPTPFAALRSGALQSNCRNTEDRKFILGDKIMFQEFKDGKLTGENHESGIITSIITGEEYGVREGFAILGWVVSRGYRVIEASNGDVSEPAPGATEIETVGDIL